MKYFILVISLFNSLACFAADPAQVTQQLALTYINNTIDNDYSKPTFLKQYFVPESWVEVIQDAVVTEEWNKLIRDPKNPGMIRVLIHPFDKISSERIENVLKKFNLPYQASTYAVPYNITESRSLYPTDSNSMKNLVSPRLSMSDGLGKWAGKEKDIDGGGNQVTVHNKLISGAQAKFAIVASRIIQKRLNEKTRAHYFEIQPERMVVAIKSPDGSLDLGMTYRDITNITRNNEHSVPGFINQNLEGGLLFALANGKPSTYQYLKDIEAPLRGRALAEFFATTGFVHSSPHSQNILITTDAAFQSKGIKIRDLPDLIPTFDSRVSDPQMAELFHNFQDARVALNKNLDGGEKYFTLRHSFVKGSNDSFNLTFEQQKEVERILADEFISTLAEISGVSTQELNSIRSENFYDVTTDYAITLFSRDTDVWRKVVTGLNAYRDHLLHGNRSILSKKSIVRNWMTTEQSILEAKIRKLIIAKLNREPISNSDLNMIFDYLKKENLEKMSSQDVDFLISSVLAFGKLPSGYLKTLISKLKNEKKYLFASLLVKSEESIVIEYLDFVSNQYSNSSEPHDYTEKKYHQNNIETLLDKLHLSRSYISSKLFEKLYFTYNQINPEYIDGLRFHALVKKMGYVPESIQNHLKEKIKSHGPISWTFDALLNAPIAPKCLYLFK